MKHKLMILSIFIVALLAISAVSAQDNATSDVVSVEDDIDKLIDVDDVEIGDIGFSVKSIENGNLLSSIENDDIDTLGDVRLVYPPSSDYSVKVNDISVNHGDTGLIKMTISPANSKYVNKYDFNLKIYDTNNSLKLSKHIYNETASKSLTLDISTRNLNPGEYTIKIINTGDKDVMDTAKLSVISVPYSAYSVRVDDVSINYGDAGSINLSISPASGYYNEYDFYLRVYDSKNKVRIDRQYVSSFQSYNKPYTLESKSLEIGDYTIKIINSHDNHVMDTAKLSVICVPYSAYSVRVDDVSINHGLNGSIKMTVSPASGYYYKYSFYLKVYDSNNNEIISEYYYGGYSSNKQSSASTSRDNDFSTTYRVYSASLSPGVYTIKIINQYEGYVMDTAKLNIDTLTIETADLEGDSNIQFKVRVVKNNEFKSGLNVTFCLNDEKYNVVTDSDGYAYLNLSLLPGNYSITTTCEGVTNKSNIFIKPGYVNNKYRDMFISFSNDQYTNDLITYGWAGNFDGYFKIYKGSSLVYSRYLNTGGYVSDNFTYTNHRYTYSINFNKLSVGSYNIQIVASNGTTLGTRPFTIAKASTKLGWYIGSTVKSPDVYYSWSSDIRDIDGNIVKTAKGKVTFKINGKSYHANVKNGKYRIKVKTPSKAKTYTCKITYSGDSNNEGSSTSFKLIVKAPAKKKTTTKKTTTKKTTTKKKTTPRTHTYKCGSLKCTITHAQYKKLKKYIRSNAHVKAKNTGKKYIYYGAKKYKIYVTVYTLNSRVFASWYCNAECGLIKIAQIKNF